MAVESDDHALLDRNVDGPDFPAHLGVHLDGDFRGDGHQHLRLGDGPSYHALRRHRKIRAAQLLDRVVSIGEGEYRMISAFHAWRIEFKDPLSNAPNFCKYGQFRRIVA